MTVPKRELRVLSNRASSTNRRARHLASSDLLASGQLWDRLADADEQMHGKPTWPFLSHRLAAMIDRVGIDDPGAFLRGLMQYRRETRV